MCPQVFETLKALHAPPVRGLLLDIPKFSGAAANHAHLFRITPMEVLFTYSPSQLRAALLDPGRQALSFAIVLSGQDSPRS